MSERATLSGHTGAAQAKRRHPASRSAARRIVVLGDFGGAFIGSRQLQYLPVAVDTLNGLMSELVPRAQVAMTAPFEGDWMLEFTHIDHFHPDHLITAVPLGRDLQTIRRELDDPATTKQALGKLNRFTEAPATPAAAPTQPKAPTGESDSETMDRLLGKRPGRDDAKARVDQFIRSTLADVDIQSHDTKTATERATHLLTECLRQLLNHPEIRSLAANWQGVDWLLRELEEDQAHVALIDLAKPTLANMLNDADSLEDTPLHALLCDSDDKPDWIVGLYEIERTLDDLTLAATLGALSGRCGATFITQGSLALCGCNDPEDATTPNNWSLPGDEATALLKELQQGPIAKHVAFLTPRFLLRYPYGQNSNPIDTFRFEELPVRPTREQFCWGNPALLYAWAAATGNHRIEQLPMPIYDDGSGQAQQPPLEIRWSERVAKRVHDHGLIPLQVDAHTGAVSLPVAIAAS